jgi:formylglycine-generating enzyme required for sulfatase activity
MNRKQAGEKCYPIVILLFVLLCWALPGNKAHAMEKEIVNSLGIEFVLIPAGTFRMGMDTKYFEMVPPRDDYIPSHQVTISKPFYLSKYEVTQEQWARLIKKNPFAEQENLIAYYQYDKEYKQIEEQLNNFKGKNKPVVYVSWKDVQEFIRTLSKKEGKMYRLSTEAEWEYAARAGTTTVYYWGNDQEGIEKYAWNGFNSDNHIHPVGQLKPNAWGLYDMSGNVWELCQDWYDKDYYKNSPAVDPKGPSSGERKNLRHVIRGGSFLLGYESMSVVTRASWKRGDRGSEGVGFRLVLEP